MSTEITTQADNSFDLAQRKAKALASTDMVPAQYKGNVANCLLALEVAERTKSSPLAVMQNLNIIHGKPAWSSSFIIAALNACGRFSPIRFKMDGESCVAMATDRESGEVLEGPPVTIQMAKDEGWYGKSGSKWKTMPELMLRYRAAAFFGRLYAPDILMGMHEENEVRDMQPSKPSVVQDINAEIVENDVIDIEPEVKPDAAPF
jgi:hypothetical protein